MNINLVVILTLGDGFTTCFDKKEDHFIGYTFHFSKHLQEKRFVFISLIFLLYALLLLK